LTKWTAVDEMDSSWRNGQQFTKWTAVDEMDSSWRNGQQL